MTGGKKGTKVGGSTPKLNLPGVVIKDILDLTEIFPKIKNSLAVVFLGASMVGQVTLLSTTLKASDISRLDSVRNYNKNILGKSPEILEVTASVALSRTMAAYATAEDTSQLIDDAYDLVNNPTGQSSTKMTLRAALNSPEALRKLRRGYMLATTGSIQAAGLHEPRKISNDLLAINGENFLDSLPFDTSDLTFEEIKAETLELLGATEISIVYNDSVDLKSSTNVTPLEEALGIRRLGATPLAKLDLPADESKLPAWRKKAIAQIKKLQGGK